MKDCNCKVKYFHGGKINPYKFDNGGLTFGGSNLKYNMLDKSLSTSINANLNMGNLQMGGEYSGIHSSGNPSKYFLGGTGRLNFGTYSGSRRGDWVNRFMGSLSGKLGYGRTGSTKQGTLSNQGLAASGRLDLKSGRPGKTFCLGNSCSAAPVPSRGLGVFGEYSNKYSTSPGLKAGGSGHFGNFNVEGGYNFTNKSPFINAGLQIPIR